MVIDARHEDVLGGLLLRIAIAYYLGASLNAVLLLNSFMVFAAHAEIA